MIDLVSFPVQALLIVEERLRDLKREGVKMPEEMPLDELALRVLVAAAVSRSTGEDEE
jgi:hypothetical protein